MVSGKKEDRSSDSRLFVFRHHHHQLHLVYSHNWAAGILTDNKKNLLPGLMLNQACSTSTTIVNLAAAAIEQAQFEVAFGLMADRISNGPTPYGRTPWIPAAK